MDIDEFGMEFIKYDYGSLCKLQLHARAVVFTRKVSSSIEKEIVGRQEEMTFNLFHVVLIN